MELPVGFTLSEASQSDMVEIFKVLELAYAKDEIWVPTFKNVNPNEIHPWVITYFMPRWTMPDIKTYKITEKASGKIVAWTALQSPWSYTPSMTNDLKASALSHDLPASLEGMDMVALGEVFACLSGASLYGYNPEKDYHRKGTMVHPDFQKRRFGSILTVHVNAISDKTGDRVWAPARPTSFRMFKNLGFKEIGVIDAHLERWGGSREKSNTYIVRRDPPST